MQLFKGEPAWNPDGTHAIDDDGRAVRKLEEDVDMVFTSHEIRDGALQCILEHRRRVAPPAAAPPVTMDLPPKMSVPEMQAQVDRLQALVTDLATQLASASSPSA